MARVVHFEIPVDDPERSQTFYRELFGWEMAGEPDEGASGRVYIRVGGHAVLV